MRFHRVYCLLNSFHLFQGLARCEARLLVGVRAPPASRKIHLFEIMMEMGEALQKGNSDFSTGRRLSRRLPRVAVRWEVAPKLGSQGKSASSPKLRNRESKNISDKCPSLSIPFGRD